MPRPISLLALILAVPLSACSSASSSGWSEGEFVAQLNDRLEIARDKFLQMAEAVPEDAWDYRPMEGVRSFSEIFMHVAADNWTPALMDLPIEEPPIDTSMDGMRAYEDEARPKAETLAELERSFDYLLSALEASRGRMGQTFMLREQDRQVGRTWIALTTHMHEHLGQSIAYARANEIVPPWSR